MKSYVIDASVAVKWYIPEPLSDAADKYLQLYKDKQAKLLAPDLLLVEVGSVLWKKHALLKLLEMMPVQLCRHLWFIVLSA